MPALDCRPEAGHDAGTADREDTFIPVFLAGHPDKTKIGAGLACGTLWTIAKGIQYSQCGGGTPKA